MKLYDYSLELEFFRNFSYKKWGSLLCFCFFYLDAHCLSPLHWSEPCFGEKIPSDKVMQHDVRVSFWHPGPCKIPIFGEKDTLLLVRIF